ncbi:MAG: hypothetical protein ACLS4Z_04775 [Christensenellaceae bacterium]
MGKTAELRRSCFPFTKGRSSIRLAAAMLKEFLARIGINRRG